MSLAHLNLPDLLNPTPSRFFFFSHGHGTALWWCFWALHDPSDSIRIAIKTRIIHFWVCLFLLNIFISRSYFKGSGNDACNSEAGSQLGTPEMLVNRQVCHDRQIPFFFYKQPFLFGLVFLYGLTIAATCRHNFGRFVAFGLTVNFSLYVFKNESSLKKKIRIQLI